MSQGAFHIGKKATRGEGDRHDKNSACWCGPQKCACGKGFKHAIVGEEGRRYCSACGHRAA